MATKQVTKKEPVPEEAGPVEAKVDQNYMIELLASEFAREVAQLRVELAAVKSALFLKSQE